MGNNVRGYPGDSIKLEIRVSDASKSGAIRSRDGYQLDGVWVGDHTDTVE